MENVVRATDWRNGGPVLIVDSTFLECCDNSIFYYFFLLSIINIELDIEILAFRYICVGFE